MSSNIKIVKICVYCARNCVAKTTVTRYCSKSCNSQHYKAEFRRAKIEQSDIKTASERIEMNSAKIEKEYPSVKEVAIILSLSKSTVYTMINSGRLRATNLYLRSTRILMNDVRELFIQNDLTVDDPISSKVQRTTNCADKLKDVSTTEWYSVPELLTMFNKSRAAINTAFARAGIHKKKIGKEVYFESDGVVKLLRKSQKPKQSALSKERNTNKKIAESQIDPSQCYSIDDCVAMFKKDRSLLYGIFNRRLIPKVRDGQRILLSKKAIDKLYKSFFAKLNNSHSIPNNIL